MFDYRLFIGLLLDDAYLRELEAIPRSLHDLFIQNNDDDYLRQIDFEGKTYLGKYLGSSIETSSLETMQAHIYSLLKRLIPHYPIDEQPLLLLAVEAKANES